MQECRRTPQVGDVGIPCKGLGGKGTKGNSSGFSAAGRCGWDAQLGMTWRLSVMPPKEPAARVWAPEPRRVECTEKFHNPQTSAWVTTQSTKKTENQLYHGKHHSRCPARQKTHDNHEDTQQFTHKSGTPSLVFMETRELPFHLGHRMENRNMSLEGSLTFSCPQWQWEVWGIIDRFWQIWNYYTL